jgi:hypothetical protein
MRGTILNLSAVLMLLVAGGVQASQDLWQDATAAQRALGNSDYSARYFTSDYEALKSLLMLAPHENTGDRSHYIQLPMPDGKLAQFAVVESPIIAPTETAHWPEVKTFKVFGIDDPHASGRVSITSLGFHGLVHTSNDWVFIDPQDFTSQNRLYKSRFKSSASAQTFKCGVEGSHDVMDHSSISNRGYASRTPGNLLEYNFAVAVTLEYYNFFGGTLLDTVSAITMTVNRVNTIYESDLGIRLILVGTTGEIYEQVESGLLDNENAFALLGVVSNWIDTRLPGGNLAYDIGHMFSQPTIGGGVANLGATCDNAFKARGVTGLPNPAGDVFDIDFVAHEVGHQFSAEHSFNGTTSSCINRNATTAYEPGSGSTIMAYAGICAAENLQNFSEATFHAGSIDQIDTYAWGGAGFACATQMANGNSDPTIATPTADRTIPINTPFLLDNTTAVDLVDSDPLTYQWDQLDAGLATNSTTFGTDLGDNALFRSYAPRTVSFRNFPALSTQLNNESDDSEVLPCSSRTIDLRLTVRDGNSGQGTDDVRVTADTGSGPFRVTSHASATNIVPNSGAVKVDWEVAKTNSAPVSCPNVVIELLTFNPAKTDYSVQSMVIGGVTANDGSEQVTLPDISNSVSRIRVRCSNNIFYHISNADLNIQGTTAITTYDIPVALTNPATTPGTAPDCPIINTGGGTSGGSNNGDASSFGFIWLLLLAGLSVVRHWLRRPVGADRESLG